MGDGYSKQQTTNNQQLTTNLLLYSCSQANNDVFNYLH